MTFLIDYFRSYFPFYRRNLKIAFPVMLAQLGQGTVQLADTIMVGHLGTTELAAASFGGAAFFIGFACSLGLSFGSTPLIGREFAAGHHRKAAELFQNSILFNLIVTILVGCAMLVVSFFLDRLGQPDDVWPLATTYYRILLASLPFVLLFQAFKQFMEGCGNTHYAMVITIIGNALNILLNYVMIFGVWGCPKFGVAGAAYATLISRVLMAVAFVAVVYKRAPYSKYFLFFKRNHFSKRCLNQLLKISAPIGLQMLLETTGMNVAVMFVGWCGEIALASHQIAINISAVTWMISCGIAAATTIRVSHQIGVKDYASMRKAGIASMHLSLAFMGTCSILMLIFKTQIASFFTNDPAVIELASTLIMMVGIYQIGDGLQTVTIGALRGLADVITPMVTAFVCYVVVCLCVSYYFGIYKGMGAVGVWIGYVVELYLASAILIFMFFKRTKKYMS